MDFQPLIRDVIKGTSNGKIVWQPRIGCWYDDRMFQNGTLPEPYAGLSLPEIYQKLGCSARTYDYYGCYKRIDDPRVRKYSRRISEYLTEETTEAPVGKLTEVIQSNASNSGVYPVKWPVTSLEEMKVDAWIQERATYEFDSELFDSINKKWGGLCIPSTVYPKVGVQWLTQQAMGLENAIYALHDHPDEVRAYLRVISQNQELLMKVMADSPIECINFGGHGDSRLLSPKMMEEYLMPECQRMNEIFHKAGKFTISHWDGSVKALLKYARELGFDAIEGITPDPQGDVALDAMKEALGDGIFLMDGIAALLFNPLYPVSRLIDQTKRVIELFAPKLVLGISDELPSTGDIGRIYIVGEIVDEYNIAIQSANV